MAEDQGFTLPPPEERPLVTFVLFAYNQESYIQSAVESALLQDYQPLQIILSDDHSTDQTFEIIRRTASGLKTGHEVIVNRNIQNLGLAMHINTILQKCDGELIVAAAGDDISYPYRTRMLVKEWIKNGKKPDLICSDYIVLEPDGREGACEKGWLEPGVSDQPTAEWLARTNHNALGATVAWSKRLVARCLPIPANVILEDHVMHMRAEMHGGTAYVRQPLLLYRKHTSSWINRENLNHNSSIRDQAALNHRNGLLVGSAQLQDALHAGRFDLAEIIASRTLACSVKYNLYSKDLNLIERLKRIWYYKLDAKSALRIIFHNHFPWLHNRLIALRKAKQNGRSS